MIRSLCLLLLAFASVFPSTLASWQYTGTTPDGDFTYTATYNLTASGAYEGTASITGYMGTASAVVIPSAVNFTANPSGQDVPVSCTVTALQSNWGQPAVFDGNTSITSVSLPATLRSIGASTFSGCTALSSITIPPTVSLIGNYAFLNCTGITTVILPEGVTMIGQNAFANCSSLTQVSLPSTITWMGVSANNKEGGVFENCTNITNLTVFTGADIGNGAFRNCTNLSSVSFQGLCDASNPGTIGGYAFFGCNSLTSITVPAGYVTLNQAFWGCRGLQSATVPSTVTQMNGAFGECSSLLQVEILSEELTSLGDHTFQDCSSLNTVAIPGTVTSIGYCTFQGSGITTLVIPENTTSIGEYAFRNCEKLQSVVIPSKVEFIGPRAFRNCRSLVSVEIRGPIGGIADEVFSYCQSLTSITLGEAVTKIGHTMFLFCPNLTSLTVPSTVSAIGPGAFFGCSSLTSAVFSGNAPILMDSSVFGATASGFACYHLPAATGFTSPTWQGYPCGIAVPYGGTLSNSASSSFFLHGGNAADGPITLQAPTCEALSLHQRQTTPVAVHLGLSGILRLGTSGILEIAPGSGPMTIGSMPNAGTLTAGGAGGANGTLILDNASTNDLTIHSVIANNGSGVVGLSKTGGGRAVLRAMNTYTGNTSISGGTLVLKSPCLADASAVTIATGSALNLDYAGADIVSSLILNGTPQPNGLYDSTNSGGLITGTGKIQVGPFANFSTWAAAIAPGQTADQDHDHDGVPNGIEYFMGASANGFTANPGIVNGTVTWPKSPAYSGSYAVQTSADLVEWTDVTADPIQVTKKPDSVVWTRPTGLGSRFVRLVVTP